MLISFVLGGITCVGAILFTFSLNAFFLYSILVLVATIVIYLKLKKTGVIRGVNRNGPLAGIKVLDLSVVIAAPEGVKNLAELGAEVIKVDNLKVIDSARGLGSQPVRGMAGCFSSTGRGKRSIVINMKSDEGKQTMVDLIKKVDVLVQNFRPGAMERLGFGYESCRDINPDLIYVSSSGFGPTGPNSCDRVYDPLIQVATGCADIQRDPKSGESFLYNIAPCDKITAMTTFNSILSALYARKHGAGGQHIILAMCDASIAFNWPDNFANYIFPAAKPVKKTVGEQVMYNGSDPASLLSEENIVSVKDFVTGNKSKKYWRDSTCKHLLFGEHRDPKFPVTFSENNLKSIPSCQFFGESSYKILRDLGYSAAKAADYLQKNAVFSTETFLRMKKMEKKAKVFGILDTLQSFNENIFTKLEPLANGTAFMDAGCAPLLDVVVVEFSHMAAGPMAGLILAESGATVFKVELENDLDPTRKMGANSENGMGALFAGFNRSKESIVVKDVKDLENAPQYGGVLKRCHVVIIDKSQESKLGISYAKMKSINPEVVYLVVNKGVGEFQMQCNSGMVHEQLNSEQKPTFMEGLLLEKVTGYYASASIVASLYKGEGERLEADLEKTCAHWNFCDLYWSYNWLEAKFMPHFAKIVDLFKVFKTNDGVEVFSAPIADREWLGCRQVFESDWAETECAKEVLNGEWDELSARGAVILRVWEAWTQIVAKYDFTEFEVKAEKSGIICGKILTREEVLQNEQYLHNKIFEVVEHPKLGKQNCVRPPAQFSITPCMVKGAAPLPNEMSAFARRLLSGWQESSTS